MEDNFPHVIQGFNLELAVGDSLMKALDYVKVEILKELMEYFAIEFGDTNNDVKYKIIANKEDFENLNIDTCFVPNVQFIPLTNEQILRNAKIVIDALIAQLNLTKAQACGVVGVLGAENGVNPASFNKGEKAGTYKSSGANNLGRAYGESHSPWSYGAGIGAWTHTPKKEQVLEALGMNKEQAKNFIMKYGIESLSLDKQITMIIYELSKYQAKTLEGIKKCNSPELAAATYYCHAVGGAKWASSTEPATQDQIDYFNKKYEGVGAHSQINKGMSWAKTFYAKLN